MNTARLACRGASGVRYRVVGERTSLDRGRPSAGLDLTRALGTDDQRISNVEPYQSNLNVHHYRLQADDDLDETFIGWLREAYGVGCGAHLRK